MASSEDVILQMPEVRYKKGGGTLYVMNKRLAWMFDNKDRVVVSHNFEDVKAQKISPEGKPKVQLQLVLHNGQSSVFHFANKEGMKAQVRDRNKVKDLLANLLPRFKRKVDKELEEKNEFLSKNPTLIQLYCDLVKTNIITSDEFWSQYATSAVGSTSSSSGNQSKGLLAEKQDVGVSGAFLADIKPQTDGCNGLKYNITKDIIESIFKTYPAVKKKFKENVPMKLTEPEFWTKFFQSHYFHRDRTNTGTNDLFTECEQIDDLQMRKDIESGVDDPNVNLSEFDDNTVNRNNIEVFPEKTSNESISHNDTFVHSNINVCQSMIKHFNQHSIMVLKASKIAKKTDVEKIQKIRDKITYDDLMEDQKSKDEQKLHLNTMDGYLVGPNYSNGDLKMKKLDSNQFTKTVLDSLRTNTKHVLTNALAVSVLGELSPGGILMKSIHHHSTENLVSKEIENEIYTLYVSVRELLKQFWSCFPVTNPESQQKLISTNEALHKFHMMKLKPFEEKLLLEFSPIANSLTNHLNQMMNSAYKKYTVWEQRKTKILHR